MKDLPQEVLSSLPSTPLAFASYCILLIVWVIIGIKVRRHTQLLRYIHKLPSSDRIKALESELGTRLKTGLSPEQWLRLWIHRYIFLGFLALCLTLIVVLSIAKIDQADQDGQRRAAADLTLYEGNGEVGRREAEVGKPLSAGSLQLAYTYDRTRKGVRIWPTIPYPALAISNGFVDGSSARFFWDFPELSFKVVNNTNDTLLLTEIEVRVVDSVVKATPVILFDSGDYESITIINIGGGAVVRPKIRFGIKFEEYCRNLHPRGEKMPYSLAINDFSDSATISLGDYLPPTDERKNQQGETIITYSIGGNACVYGSMSYRAAEKDRREIYFKTLVAYGPLPVEGFLAASSKVTGLLLEAGVSGYTQRLPISHYLPAGGVDHFVLVVGTDRSATFDAVITLITADGIALSAKNVQLDIWVPTRTKEALLSALDTTGGIHSIDEKVPWQSQWVPVDSQQHLQEQIQEISRRN